jgi:hypothetical protein
MSGGTAIRTEQTYGSKYLLCFLSCEKLHHSYRDVKSSYALTPLTVTSCSPGHSIFEIYAMKRVLLNSICACQVWPHTWLWPHKGPRGIFGGQNYFGLGFLPVLGLYSDSIIPHKPHSHTHLPPSLNCNSSWQRYARRQVFLSVCLSFQSHYALNKNCWSVSWKAIIASNNHSVATLRQQ